MTTEQAQISAGIGQIFLHRESFIVIALTGRTGSGCTTAANILSEGDFAKVPLPTIPAPPATQEDRKDRIVLNWIREQWHPFQTIQVSQVILLLTLTNPVDDVLAFVEKNAPNADLLGLRTLLEPNYAVYQTVHRTLLSLRSATDDDVRQACTFISSSLPELSRSVKELINTREDKAYTRVFQALGDNVRRSGNALLETVDPKALLLLPSTLASIIKLFRLRNRIDGIPKNYFVIDALRHPFEIRYLRERISPFYAVAISTGDLSRRTRLANRVGLRKEEIDELDEKEYPSEVKSDTKKRKRDDYSAFVSQNIQACLEIADIYISNHGDPETEDLQGLGRQLCRYVALMQHPGLITPTNIERCMHAAFSAKLNSGCISRQVGAVVTDENYSIKAVGWNDVPKGQVPCLLRNTAHALNKKWDPRAYSTFEKNEELFLRHLAKTKLGKVSAEHYAGRNSTYCFKAIYNGIKGDKNQVHTRALHAEENAFLQIAKYGGQALQGGCLFTTASPCELCAKKAYQIGISRIYYIDPYPGISNDHILSGGENPPDVILFFGAIGRAYHELYLPIMAYKEELERFIPE